MLYVKFAPAKKFKINANPKMRIHQTENISVILNFLTKDEGFTFTNIGASNIVDGDKKLILGLIGQLIEWYQIEEKQVGGEVMSKAEVKNELLEWVKGMLPEYNVQNFTSSWQSGKEICALVEAVMPGQLDVPNCFSDDPVLDAFLGINAATENMDIPPLVDASDMVEKPDELSLMMYISYFRHFANRPKEIPMSPRSMNKKDVGPQVQVTPCVIMSPELDSSLTIFKMVTQDPSVTMDKIQFTGQDANGKAVVCNVNDIGNSANSVYELAFTPTSGGNHTFKVAIDGKPCPNFPVEGLVIELPTTLAKKVVEIKKESTRPTARPTANTPQMTAKYQTVAFLEKVNDQNENNYIVMIDKSSSMKAPTKTNKNRWGQSAVVLQSLAQACCDTSPEGISVYFFGSKGKLDVHNGIKSQQQVVDLYAKTVPYGTTCLDGALATAFKSHFARDPAVRAKVPTSILVITDGEPDSKTAVVDEIIAASKKCKAKEISISLLQVGNDTQCGEFFKKLNKPKNKAKFANCPVDCLSYGQVGDVDGFVSAGLSTSKQNLSANTKK
jgi:hypothetical protein